MMVILQEELFNISSASYLQWRFIKQMIQWLAIHQRQIFIWKLYFSYMKTYDLFVNLLTRYDIL